jgi:hypothetical protein
MSPRPPDIADLGWTVGDHVCGFYADDNSLDDIVARYVSQGLQAGDKCVCLLDRMPPVRARIPDELMRREGTLKFLPEDEAYLSEGHFSTDVFIGKLEGMVKEALSEGFERFRLLGSAAFLLRNAVDMKSWFACEAQINEFAPQYPQFIMCLYDLDRFSGETVMYVLRTHPRLFVNGILIPNPHYVPTREFLASL